MRNDKDVKIPLFMDAERLEKRISQIVWAIGGIIMLLTGFSHWMM